MALNKNLLLALLVAVVGILFYNYNGDISKVRIARGAGFGATTKKTTTTTPVKSATPAPVKSGVVASPVASVVPSGPFSPTNTVPPQPAAYPSADETLMITGSYLNDPIVTNALAYVNAVVPAAILNYAPSKYIQYSTVTYTANPTTTCYWPDAQCTRTTSGTWGAADIVYCNSQNQWGLTYDDAPSVNLVGTTHVNDTYTIMDGLSALNLKATFFVTGSQTIYYPDALAAVASAQHHVAHHSWSHHPMTSLTNAQIVAEMEYTTAAIYKVTGLTMRYFRPPYGDIDDRVRAIVNALGYRIVIWDGIYDSTDADVTANAASYTTVMNIIKSWFNVPQGFISLQHTISTFTSGTSADTLRNIKAMGGINNQMMPVPQCLGDVNWYKNKQITTVWNTCTKPAGCSGVVQAPQTQASPNPAPLYPVSSTGACSATAGSCPSGANCCSQYGYCGQDVNGPFCGAGCQPAFSFNGKCA
ncbi:hypothetical protein SmJEL517_g04897 [Synchytrium microbalum]|uniref:NodB homology domain-containing protein n=1 Tax=Synchytrium microbalum TaxID=1806994 RepID=A0A507C194_9FUNG|nr:uncharacterized protein SmJEL517_g04897 [Synchytrium microbalum]TPX31834.1 hypothetical protein SmJEL517_g04897 [Synchytrium microbalum]